MLAEEKLEALPLQIRKVMQFHEACQQRMGVVVVGPSGCGKSTIWRLLLKANAKLGRKIPTYVMNPKPLHPPTLNPLQFDEVAELDPFTGTDMVVNMDADGCALLLQDES